MLFINLEFKKAASNVISDAIQVLKNLEVIALLIACFVLGEFDNNDNNEYLIHHLRTRLFLTVFF